MLEYKQQAEFTNLW